MAFGFKVAVTTSTRKCIGDNKVYFFLLSLFPLILPQVFGAGFRTVGSSGCAVQMIFVPPNTTTAVFIDNYHVNYGGPGVNLDNGAPSPNSYLYDGTDISVFGTEYNLATNGLRPLRPLSNTFCSAGSFFPDGTLANVAGAEPGPSGVAGMCFNEQFHPL